MFERIHDDYIAYMKRTDPAPECRAINGFTVRKFVNRLRKLGTRPAVEFADAMDRVPSVKEKVTFLKAFAAKLLYRNWSWDDLHEYLAVDAENVSAEFLDLAGVRCGAKHDRFYLMALTGFMFDRYGIIDISYSDRRGTGMGAISEEVAK